MRALVYTAAERVEMQDRPRPTPGVGEVEIAVEMSGVCGSDISGFLGHSALRKPPLVLGHELVGWRAGGTRVVANPLISCGHCDACLSAGCFAEYVVLPEAQVHPIPDMLPSARAVLAEPLANIVHLFRLCAPPPFFRLAIVGAGTMGALALGTGLGIGAKDMLVVDVNEERLAIMREIGASHAVHTGSPEGVAEAQKIAGRGFDLVIDASGSASARQVAFDLCRPGGLVALLGMGAQKSEINFVGSIRKEHRVVMSFAYTPVNFQRALSLLSDGAIDLAPWTVRLPLEQGQQALHRMSHAPGAALKMLLEVNAPR